MIEKNYSNIYITNTFTEIYMTNIQCIQSKSKNINLIYEFAFNMVRLDIRHVKLPPIGGFQTFVWFWVILVNRPDPV